MHFRTQGQTERENSVKMKREHHVTMGDGSDVLTSHRTPEATEGRRRARTVPSGAPSGERGPADTSILDFWLSEGETVNFWVFSV